ncbi:hypothetical protein [Streptomyces sp. NPDC002962]|uniref:hypothetical protein n=1 Tax=Streptomyces sp. NPDC002962 TaxID=3364674 RepID=UPI0036CAF48C
MFTDHWANWSLCKTACVLAIGILDEVSAQYDQAVADAKFGAGNGSVAHAVPSLYADADGYDLGQRQERGRGSGRHRAGHGAAGRDLRVARNQGGNLYRYDSKRFLKAARYVAAYPLGNDVPFPTSTLRAAGRPVRGTLRPPSSPPHAGRPVRCGRCSTTKTADGCP